MSNVKSVLDEFKNLPRFEDGRINYTNSKRAPALVCFLMFQDRILLLKRSDKVLEYKGMWSSLCGFVDDPNKSIREQVLEEMSEELSISGEDDLDVKEADVWEFYDKEIDKTWIQFPVLVELNKKPDIKLDWENTDYKWIKPEEISKIDGLIFGVEENLKRALALI